MGRAIARVVWVFLLARAATVRTLRAMLAWHVTHALSDRRVVATEAADLRVVARTVIEAGGAGLLAFRASDNHVHTLFAGDRASAGSFARDVANALHNRLDLPVPFEPTDIRPIRAQGHLGSTFRYVLGNAENHGAAHDRLFEASNLPDLLGMRSIGALTRVRVRAMLPRVDRAFLLALLGIDALAPAFDPALLVEAACAAAALPSLATRTPAAVAARIAAMHVAAPHLSPRESDALLEVPSRTGRRLRGQPRDEALIVAIGLQIDLRLRLGVIAPDAPFLAVARGR